MAGTGEIKAGGAFVEISTRDKLDKGLRAAEKRLKAFGDSVTEVGTKLAKIGTAALAAGFGAAKAFSDVGDAVEKASKRTGISAESISALAFAADQSGTDIKTLETGIKSMQRVLTDAAQGSASASDSLSDLGLTIDELRGLTPEQQFKLIAQRVSEIADPTNRAAVAMDVFGKAGQQLLPLVENGASGIEELMKEAQRLGLVMDTETATAAAQLNDEFGRMFGVLKQATVTIGAALAPVMHEVSQAIRENVTEVIRWVKANQQTVITALKVAAGVAAIGVAVVAIGKVITGFASVLGAVAGAVKGLTAAFTFLAAHPVVAVIAAITAGVIALSTAIQRANTHTAQLSEHMAQVVKRGDEQRRTTQLQLERLQQLSDKQRLTNDEMDEAAHLIQNLQSRYGDLGLSVDRAAGSIIGLADAQSKVNDLMRQAAKLDITAAMSELETNIAEVRKELQSFFESFTTKNPLRLAFRFDKMSFGDGDKQFVAELEKKIKEFSDRRQALALRLEALNGGDPSAVAGDATKKDDAAEVQDRIQREIVDRRKLKEEAVKAEQELVNLEAQRERRRRTATENEIADVKAEATERRKLLELLIQAEKAKAKPNDLRIGDLQRSLLLVDVQEQGDIGRIHQKEIDERAKEEAKARQQRLSAEEQLAEEIARLKIETTKEGLDRELALLELERQQALKDAGDLGIGSELVNKKFDLRKQLLEAADATPVELGSSARGTFNAQALQSLQTDDTDKRIAEAAEETARNTKRIIRNQEHNGLAFG